MTVETVELRFQVGELTLFSFRRRMLRQIYSLKDVLANCAPPQEPLPAGVAGLAIRSIPASQTDAVVRNYPGYVVFEQQSYPRHFITMDGDFDNYLQHFSGKSRSSLRRKLRKWQEFAGDTDIREYRSPDEVDEFYHYARTVSQTTYQERLLDAGLPKGDAALDEMRRLAAADSVRAYLLFHDGRPVSYLYLPSVDRCLIYSHLGYDPTYAQQSPGTVLQMVALEHLFAEGRFRLFDFTEGDGQHKRTFGTDSVDCRDLIVLSPTLANYLVAAALHGFDATVNFLSDIAQRLGIKARLRRILRGKG